MPEELNPLMPDRPAIDLHKRIMAALLLHNRQSDGQVDMAVGVLSNITGQLMSHVTGEQRATLHDVVQRNIQEGLEMGDKFHAAKR